MFKPLAPAVLAAVLTVPATGHADGDFYFKGFGGVSDLQSDTLSFGGAASSVDYDTGVIFGGAFGYDYAGSPWRSEIEYAYRSSDATPVPSIGTGGDFASTSLMINGFYSFGGSGALRPYAGLGIGVVTEIDFDIDAGPAAGEYNDSGGFAAQLMVGADYAVSDRVSLFGELRYFSAGSQTLDGPGGSTFEADYDSLDALVGLTVRF